MRGDLPPGARRPDHHDRRRRRRAAELRRPRVAEPFGRVAFTAFDDESAKESVLVGRGGPLTEVASTLGDFSSFGSRGPSLNAVGRVAFQAELDDFASTGVFTGPDAAADAVIRTGDVVGGRTVQSVSGCREMLNLLGQVAVRATFDDGSQAIVRATPVRAGQ